MFVVSSRRVRRHLRPRRRGAREISAKDNCEADCDKLFILSDLSEKKSQHVMEKRGVNGGGGGSGRGSTCLLKTHFLPGGNEKRFERIRKAMDD